MEEDLEQRRSELPARIKVEQMPESQKYNRPKEERKMLVNIIKMICYRSETAVANLLVAFIPDYGQGSKRMLTKQIILSNADLIVDGKAKTLTIVLHSLSANRFNQVADKLDIPEHVDPPLP